MKIIFAAVMAFLVSLSAMSVGLDDVNDIPELDVRTYTELDIPEDPIDHLPSDALVEEPSSENPYGIFWIVVKPVEFIFSMIDSQVNSLAITLIIFVILIKLLFYKINFKAYVAKKNIAKYSQEIKDIKDRYKDNPEEWKKKTMDIYDSKKANPGDVLTAILAQIPIFIIVMVLINHLTTTTNSGFLHIEDISLPDPSYVMPIILGIAMMYEQRQHVSGMSQTAKVALLIFPMIFAYIFTYFSAGILLYIFTFIVVGIIQDKSFEKKYND